MMVMVAVMPMPVMPVMFFVRLDHDDFRRAGRFRHRRKTIEDERQQYKCEQFFHGFDLRLMDYFAF